MADVRCVSEGGWTNDTQRRSHNAASEVDFDREAACSVGSHARSDGSCRHRM